MNIGREKRLENMQIVLKLRKRMGISIVLELKLVENDRTRPDAD